MKRNANLIKNTFSSIIFQIATILCGLIIPRLILQNYGSEVNGLVNSITQFFAIITFLEFGVGAVVQSSLYKPLAENNINKISLIISSANTFFRKIAKILLIYIIVLILVYPKLVNNAFGWWYTTLLIISMSISFFAQYYFGVVDRLLLNSDQKGYVQYNAQTITLIFNTIACYVMIKLGTSIQLVKLITSLIYLVRPIYLHWYVDRYYKIIRNISCIDEPIKQKWNGVAQHIAAIVLDSTALIILSLFDNLKSVSIYTVYFFVVAGIKQLFIASTNGIQALLGDLYARREIIKLRRVFAWTEWSLHNLTMFLFGCTGCLIVPFVMVYTSGVSDANYYQPIFALLLVTAHSLHCLRLPYNLMILAAGHYKQTQNNYIIATILNLTISIVTIRYFGFIGIALGALIALFYQVVWMALYNSKNLLFIPFRVFIKQIVADITSVLLSASLCLTIDLNCSNYISWTICSLKIAIIWIVTLLITNYIMYTKEVKTMIAIIYDKIIHLLELNGGGVKLYNSKQNSFNLEFVANKFYSSYLTIM